MTDYPPPPSPSPFPSAPSPPPSQAPAPKKQSHKVTVIVAVVTLVLGVAIGYAARGSNEKKDTAASSASPMGTRPCEASVPPCQSVSDEALPSDAVTTDETEAQPELSPSDFTIGIKVRKKECFGSAGCNVTYRIDPNYIGLADISTGDWDITYIVKGGSDGTSTNTMTLSDGRFTFDGEELASTDSKSDKLTAKVTVVEISA